MKEENLNEEIKRMQQLMGDGRLYGNLVVNENTLLTEAAGKVGVASDLLGAIFDGVFKKLPKKTLSRKFPKPKGLNEPWEISLEKSSGGGYIVKKNGVKINHKNIKNIISPLADRQISTITAKIVNEADVIKFFNEDIYEVYRIMFTDLMKQAMVSDVNAVTLIVNGIKASKIGARMLKNLRDPDFFKGLYSLADLKKIHRGLFDVVDEIPDLKATLFRDVYEDKLTLGLLSNDVSEIAKMLNGFNKSGNVMTPQGKGTYTISNKKTGLDGIIEVDLDAGTIELSKELLDNAKIDDRLLDYSPTYGEKEFYTINIKAGKIEGNERKVINDLLNFKKQKKGLNIPKKEVQKIKTDIAKSTANIEDKLGVFKKRDDVMNALIRANLPKWRQGVGEFVRNILVDKGWRQGVLQSFSKKYRFRFDPVRLKKEGYALPGSPHTENILDTEQVNFIKQFYGFEKESGQSLFVRATDTDLINLGHSAGDIHPQAFLAPDFKQRMYKVIASPFNKNKTLKTLWLDPANRSYRSFQKTIGRGVLTFAPFTVVGGQYMIYHTGKVAIDTASSAAVMSPMNDLLKDNGDIQAIAVPAYNAACRDDIIQNFGKQGLEKSAFLSIAGEWFENGLLSDIGKVKLEDDAIEGESLIITYQEILDRTWDPIDKRTINEKRVVYKIMDWDKYETADGSIKIEVGSKNGIGMIIFWDKEKLRVGKQGDPGVIELRSTLKCLKFSEWWLLNRGELWGGDAMEKLNKVGQDAIVSTVIGDGPDLGEFKEDIMAAVKDIQEMELDDWIGAAGTGAGVVKDGIEGASGVIDQGVKYVEDDLSPSQINKSDMKIDSTMQIEEEDDVVPE